MVCIFTALLFLNLQECPGAEDDLLVPLKLVDPVSFRLFADRPDRDRGDYVKVVGLKNLANTKTH